MSLVEVSPSMEMELKLGSAAAASAARRSADVGGDVGEEIDEHGRVGRAERARRGRGGSCRRPWRSPRCGLRAASSGHRDSNGMVRARS